MIKKGLIKSMLLMAVFTSSGAYAATQSIVATPSSFSDVSVGDTVQFTVNYPASNPDATGLGLKIYYDSTKLTLNGTSNVYATNKLAESVQDDTSNGDGDASTDKLINIAWVSFSGSWPAPGNDLVTAAFTAATGFTSDTQINFTGDPAAGNTFSASPIPVKLKVVGTSDTTPPVVTAPANITKEATGPTTPVNLGTGTATDDVDGAITPTASPTGPFAVGVHFVTWSATDAAGNTGSATQKVTITDTTPPVVTPPANKTVTATGTHTSVSLGTATATDIVDGTVTATPSTTGPFPVGTTIVTWSATDAAGNTGTATQTVTVTGSVVAPPKPTFTIKPPTVTQDDSVDIEIKGKPGSIVKVNGAQVGVLGSDGKLKLSLDTSGLDGVKYFSVTLEDEDGNTSSPLNFVITKSATTKSIPTLSEWAIILLSLLLAMVSWFEVGRRNKI